MSEVNIFASATRKKVRFDHKGSISIEELWDLKLADLKSVYQSLTAQLTKDGGEDNIFGDTGKSKEEIEKAELLSLKIEIVKQIAAVKKEENDARDKEAANKALTQKILGIKAKRADAALLDASDEELDAILKDLES